VIEMPSKNNKPKEYAFRNMLRDERLTFKEWIERERVQKRKPAYQIEREQGVSWDTIKRWATKYEKINFSRKPIKNVIAIRKETLKTFMKRALTANQMAKELNVAPNTIRTKLRAYKLIGEEETLPEAYKRLGYLNKKELYELKMRNTLKSHYLIRKYKHPDGVINEEEIETLQKYMNYAYFHKAPFSRERILKMIEKIEEPKRLIF
jgi:transposase